MKFFDALPQFAAELAEGLAELGHPELARSVREIEIAHRCECDEPGCLTFDTVPITEAVNWGECRRVVAPVPGVLCVLYRNDAIMRVEALGRPHERELLDRLESEDPDATA